MDTSIKHTPLPWRIVPIGSERYIESDAGFVCDMQRNACIDEFSIYQCEANAAFIVQAVNSHYALVEALKLTLGQLEGVKSKSGVHSCSLAADIRIAKAALALATKAGQ